MEEDRGIEREGCVGGWEGWVGGREGGGREGGREGGSTRERKRDGGGKGMRWKEGEQDGGRKEGGGGGMRRSESQLAPRGTVRVCGTLVVLVMVSLWRRRRRAVPYRAIHLRIPSFSPSPGDRAL